MSTYLQKEWLSHYPDTGLSAKALLKAYQDNFEQDKPINGTPSRGGFRGGPRKPRGRGGGRGRGGQVAVSRFVPNNVPDIKVEPKDPLIEGITTIRCIEKRCTEIWCMLFGAQKVPFGAQEMKCTKDLMHGK